MKTIGHYAFAECSALTEISLPDSVESVLNGAFAYCPNLETVILSERLQTISPCTFEGCHALQRITLPDSVTSIDYDAFRGCDALKEISLSSNLESIGSGAFVNCDNLRELILPEKINYLEESIFMGCDRINSITIEARTMPQFDGNPFEQLRNNCTVYVPSELLSEYRNAFDKVHFESIEQ